MVDIGKVIRKRRDELRLSAEKLAQMVSSTRSSVVLWEKGSVIPEDKTLMALGHALQIDGSNLVAFKYLNRFEAAGVDLKSLLRAEVLIHYDSSVEGLRDDSSQEEVIAAKLIREERYFDLIRFGTLLAEDRGAPRKKLRRDFLGVTSPFVLNESAAPYPSEEEAATADPDDASSTRSGPRRRKISD